MARDLIPPPSPAGKPPPDPEGDPRRLVEEPAATEEAPPAPSGPSPVRGRFGFIFGALAGIAVCAAALAVALAAGGGEDGPKLAANWSAWKPGTTKMLAGAEDIAAHVGLEYKLDDGNQLVSVRSSGMEFQGGELGVAVRPQGQNLQFLDGKGLMYVLTGLGPNGAVASGKPTQARGRLLRREALELALYSFRYLDDVTMVAVLLPPPSTDPSKKSTSASSSQDSQQIRTIFYRPGDLLDELQVPLSATLSPTTPRPKTMTKAEGLKVDSLVLRNLFLAQIQPLTADKYYLVLTEPAKIQ